MTRYMVQHWFLDELGNDILKSEVVFETEKEARVYSSSLQSSHSCCDGYHSFNIVLMVAKSSYLYQPIIKE